MRIDLPVTEVGTHEGQVKVFAETDVASAIVSNIYDDLGDALGLEALDRGVNIVLELKTEAQ